MWNNNKIIIVLFLCILKLGYSQVPTLGVHYDTKEEHLPIHTMAITVAIEGTIAKTTFDLTFYNPYDRTLEGEFAFPLAEGQDVCRYALDLNGNLREGVVIEKVKARQVYEAVVRQKIDPGILEKTKGNFYKTKIFPIPAKGYKRVVFAVEDILPIRDNEVHYVLPMGTTDTIQKFTVQVDVIKSKEQPKSQSDGYSTFTFDTASNIYQLRFDREQYTPTNALDFKVPVFDDERCAIYTGTFEEEGYFYANMEIPNFKTTPKKAPKHIGIYWDASFSATERDLETELQFLQQYLEQWDRKITVHVHTFNYTQTQEKKYTINGDASAIVNALKQTPTDGATSLASLQFSEQYDEILLFSDGVTTMGKEDITFPKTPIYTFNTTFGANYSTLRHIATTTNGNYIQLTPKTIKEALTTMTTETAKYRSCDIDSKAIQELVVVPFSKGSNHFAIAGKLLVPETTITVNFGNATAITWSETITISKSKTPTTLIPRVWARAKIAALDMQYEKNKEQITALGKEYAIVTRNTSFIVLDRIEDYVTHKIVPPKELREQYYALIAKEEKVHQNEKKQQQQQLQHVIRQLESIKEWYQQPIVKKAVPKVERNSSREVLAATREARPRARQRRSVSRPRATEERVIEAAPISEADMVEEHEAMDMESTAKKQDSKVDSGPKIKLLAWQPEAPYLDSLRKAPSSAQVSVYHRLKIANKNTPSFYIEVADFFFKANQKEHAITVLSNVLELDLENAELLKVAAKRLLTEGETTMAVALYAEIVSLRPEEPQSHRDLALAYVADKEYQKALDLYAYILTTKWERFTSVKEIIVNEMNALITAHKEHLDLTKIDKTLLYEMPLDIRIVVDWSSNDSDIDLWVVDPKGEKCFYSNKHTALGGKMSTDITRGYGPEEFSLKKATRGFYTIYVNYYSESRQRLVGPVTVYATLYTNYGRENQKVERIAIQLENGASKKTLQLGQLAF